jgi:uncharacterized protein (TIGR03437 family)
VPISAENPAKPSETLTVWASGLGSVGEGDGRSTDGDTLLPVSALVNGEPAQVLSARLPKGVVGIYEVAITLPANLGDRDEVRLQLVENAALSNTVTIPVKALP